MAQVLSKIHFHFVKRNYANATAHVEILEEYMLLALKKLGLA